MALPRAWEHGEGYVSALRPAPHDLTDVKAGRISIEEYRKRFEAQLAAHAPLLVPGVLAAKRDGRVWFVESGSTLCCACGVGAAREGKCHRTWAAAALKAAGWNVVLDGVEL